ncbi:MAG TPA: hypothetical protein VGI67_05795 [Thermoleophilaceae bacterium]|jgi:hypothetical protein
MRARTELLLWGGVLAAPAAWTIEHVLGYGVTEAACGTAGAGSPVPTHTWLALATALGAALALAGIVAAALSLRSVWGSGNDAPPPPGRIWFMSVCGLVLSPLFLLIILLDGIGALLLGGCHQG